MNQRNGSANLLSFIKKTIFSLPKVSFTSLNDLSLKDFSLPKLTSSPSSSGNETPTSTKPGMLMISPVEIISSKSS